MKRHRRGGDSGMLLIEALVALAILAIALVCTLSMAASTTGTRSKFDPYEQSLRAMQSLADALQNYSSPAVNPLPDAADFAPNGSWQLPGDSCLYALQIDCNPHNASAFLPDDGDFRAKYPKATLGYTVTQATPDDPLRIDFTVTLQ